MPRLKIGLLYVFAITLVCGVALGADFYVDATNGSNSNSGRSPDAAWLNIGYALSKVRGTMSDQATVHIAAGAYSASANAEPFPINMKSYVSLLGAGADTTILDAEGDAKPVIYCGYVTGVALGSLTIKGGNAEGDLAAGRGGGIMCGFCDGFMIKDCTVTENNAVMGGGLYLTESSGLICSCEIISNTVDGETDADGLCAGAGIAWVNCSLHVDGCVIAENEAFGRRDGGSMGAGVLAANYAPSRGCMTDQMGCDAGQRGRYIVISNCVISDNYCDDDTNSRAMGGGICLIDSSPSILNSFSQGIPQRFREAPS